LKNTHLFYQDSLDLVKNFYSDFQNNIHIGVLKMRKTVFFEDKMLRNTNVFLITGLEYYFE